MKLGRMFFRSMSLLKPATFYKPSPQAVKVMGTGLGLGIASWFSTRSIFSDELTVLETDDNLVDGEVRELIVGPKPEDTILVINYQGDIYSVQSKCSHFGFNLAKGLLVGDQLICPLHNAGFSIKTGEPNQGPVFNGLKTFEVQRVDGKIKVSVPKKNWSSAPEYKEIGKDNVDKSQKIVIIGAGPTALSAAETLRRANYKGLIYLVTKEKGTNIQIKIFPMTGLC